MPFSSSCVARPPSRNKTRSFNAWTNLFVDINVSILWDTSLVSMTRNFNWILPKQQTIWATNSPKPKIANNNTRQSINKDLFCTIKRRRRKSVHFSLAVFDTRGIQTMHIKPSVSAVWYLNRIRTLLLHASVIQFQQNTCPQIVAVGFVRISKHKLHLPVPEKYSFGPDDREDVSLYKKKTINI